MRIPLDGQALREALDTPPWAGIDVLPECASTNAEVARAGLWHVVTTDHQVAGRGRLGRAWETPALATVALSTLLPAPTAAAGWLPLLAGLAVQRAVAQVSDLHAVLKWPNDVLVAEDGLRKVCGVLCELGPAGVVVGIGVNVDQDRAELPVGTATSLRLCGAAVSREALILAVLRHLLALHTALLDAGPGLEAAQAAYRGACATIGAEVDLHRGAGRVERAVALGVDREGRLLVDAGAGAYAVAAGDVVHVRPGGPPGAVADHTA